MASTEDTLSIGELVISGHESYCGKLGITRKLVSEIIQGNNRKRYVQLNNGAVIELFNAIGSLNDFYIVLCCLLEGAKDSAKQTLNRKTKDKKAAFSKLREKRKPMVDLIDFLKKPFTITQQPKCGNAEAQKHVTSTQDDQLPAKKPKMDIAERSETSSAAYRELKTKTQQLQEERDLLSKAYDDNNRNLNKKVHRRDNNIKKQKENVAVLLVEKNNLEVEVVAQQLENEELVKKNEQLEKEKKDVLKKSSDAKSKAKAEAKKDDTISALRKKVKDQAETIRHLEDTITQLQEKILNVKENGVYSDKLNETCMGLMATGNVSMRKVNFCIRLVVKNLFEMEIPELPSMGKLYQLMFQAKIIASYHVAEELLKDADSSGKTGHVVHTDATSKDHRHFEGFQVTTAKGRTLSTGMNEIAGGSGEDIAESFMKMIDDLVLAFQNGEVDVAAALIASLKHLMTDQCSSNLTFFECLEKIRSDVLPIAIKNWETLPAELQKDIKKMDRHFCKMHLVVNFATESDKVLKLFEANVAEGRNPYAFGSDSGALRLTHTACKAFTKRGCGKSGVQALFKSYLDLRFKNNNMVTFHGHRFNITFYDAAAVYYHRNDIKNFISSLAKPNQLLESVLFDIQEPGYLAGIRALGIIDKIITGPFWRLLEMEGGMYTLNPRLLHMKVKMDEWSKDASPLLEGGIHLFDDVEVHDDEIYNALFEPATPDINCLTQLALEVLMSSLLIILERQAKDNLPGGRHWEPTEADKSGASHVPKTNNCSERDFAMLDNIMRNKPGAGLHVAEVLIMWTNNRTAEWLAGLSEQERLKVFRIAKEKFPELQDRLTARKVELKEKQLVNLKERQDKKDEADRKHHSACVQLTNKVTLHGGVWKKEDIGEHVQELTEKDAKEAVHSQLLFHREVLHAKGERQLFQKSSKGQLYSVDTLIANLKKVLDINSVDDEPTTPGLVYREQEDFDQRMRDLKSSLKERLLEGRQKRLADSAKQDLTEYVARPTKLLGKKILHRCRYNGETEWFPGRVMRITQTNQEDPMKTKYSIQYDDDPEEDWRFPLLQDIKKGDIIFL